MSIPNNTFGWFGTLHHIPLFSTASAWCAQEGQVSIVRTPLNEPGGKYSDSSTSEEGELFNTWKKLARPTFFAVCGSAQAAQFSKIWGTASRKKEHRAWWPPWVRKQRVLRGSSRQFLAQTLSIAKINNQKKLNKLTETHFSICTFSLIGWLPAYYLQ